MNERITLMVILTALYLGSRMPTDIGADAFYALLGAGWAVVVIWTFVAWRRGEKVISWQHRHR